VRLKAPGLGAFHVLADAVDAASVHCLVNQCMVVEQRLDRLAVEDAGHCLGFEVCENFRPLAEADRLDQQVA